MYSVHFPRFGTFHKCLKSLRCLAFPTSPTSLVSAGKKVASDSPTSMPSPRKAASSKRKLDFNSDEENPQKNNKDNQQSRANEARVTRSKRLRLAIGLVDVSCQTKSSEPVPTETASKGVQTSPTQDDGYISPSELFRSFSSYGGYPLLSEKSSSSGSTTPTVPLSPSSDLSTPPVPLIAQTPRTPPLHFEETSNEESSFAFALPQFFNTPFGDV